MTRIAVFVDVQNIYYTTRDVWGRPFNYRKLWEYLASQGDITTAIAYATHKADDGQHKFQTALRHIGFDVKLKPYIQRSDGSRKGDWDVGIAVDMMDVRHDVDRIVLLSGDGDFDYLLHRLSEDEKLHTTVFGVAKLTADSLVRSTNEFIAIDDSWLIPSAR